MAEDVQEVQQLREMELQLQATKAHQAQEEARKASEIESLKEALATAEAEERAKEEAFQAQLEAAEREKQEQAARLEVMQEEKKVVGELSKKRLRAECQRRDRWGRQQQEQVQEEAEGGQEEQANTEGYLNPKLTAF